MKAVIWTDVTQTIMMFVGVILSIIFGFKDAGGIKDVFNKVIDGNRLQLSTCVIPKGKKKILKRFFFSRITFDPSIRYTVWSIILGGGLNATAVYSCLQTQAQRYLCVKSTRSAQK